MQDIHTHLYWESYDTDRDAVIARAHDAGIDQLFTIGCTVEESRQCVALAEKYPEIYASVGVHPQEFFDESGILNLESWIGELRTLAKHEKVIAIGECGLEYYSHDPKQWIVEEQKQWQKKAFSAQIELAQELHLPLIVHCRPSLGTQDAYEDLFRILSEASVSASWQMPAILHCYMGDTEVTKKFLTLPNVHFSFTGNITYPVKKTLLGTKDDLSETVKLIPLDRIFAETDCPFLAPQSHRGERNEPSYVREVLTRMTELHTIDTGRLTRAIEANFKRVFPVIQ